MIILNETEWVEKLLSEESPEDSSSETLTRIARYYFEKGFKKKDIQSRIGDYLIKACPGIAIPKWVRTIDYAVKNAEKRKSLNIEYITVTKRELEIIRSLSGEMIERLAFTLLCLSKYWDALTDVDTHWVNTKISEVMYLANIKASVKYQCKLIRTLKEAGLIGLSKKIDNNNVEVLFGCDDEEALRIYDFRNLGWQYQWMKKGKGFYQCQLCGLVCKEKKNKEHGGRNNKYCPECAEIQKRTSDRLRYLNNKSS